MMILTDQDGVLADFELGLRDACKRIPELRDKIVEYKDRVNFSAVKDYPEHLRSRVASIYHRPRFFRNLKMVSGARKALFEMLEDGHEVRICTAPLTNYRHCVLEKFEWVEEHLGHDFTKRIILARDKTVIRGDYLIDDKPVVEGSYDSPLWKRIVFDCPYNKSAVGIRLVDWSNWRQVLKGG
jgi:5'-nucleotidase